LQKVTPVKPAGKQQPEAKKPKQESKEKKTVAEKEKEKEEEAEEEEEKEGKKKSKGRCIKECELLIFEIYRLLGGSVCGCKQ
jgi:uncharacterized membrane protein YdbT with pleckstrin-like domain